MTAHPRRIHRVRSVVLQAGSVGAASQNDLSAVLRALEDAAPRLYSRWSPKAWRLICQGPATRLWEALADSPDGRAALEDYLFLAREAVGMQYLAATRAEDLAPGAPAHGFLAVMICETLPRLLPDLEADKRAGALAQVWNVGERLIGRPVWLDRYLAARLPELDDLGAFADFLSRIVEEGLDELPPARFEGETAISILDPTGFDRAFLPGEMHLATPSVVCVHDRRNDERHIALMLRRGKSVCLGVTPCLGREAKTGPSAPEKFLLRALAATGLADRFQLVSASSGFAVFASELSQRLWVGESER